MEKISIIKSKIIDQQLKPLIKANVEKKGHCHCMPSGDSCLLLKCHAVATTFTVCHDAVSASKLLLAICLHHCHW